MKILKLEQSLSFTHVIFDPNRPNMGICTVSVTRSPNYTSTVVDGDCGHFAFCRDFLDCEEISEHYFSEKMTASPRGWLKKDVVSMRSEIYKYLSELRAQINTSKQIDDEFAELKSELIDAYRESTPADHNEYLVEAEEAINILQRRIAEQPKPIATMPKTGEQVYLLTAMPVVFNRYKDGSEQKKRGIVGRWQKCGNYGGWENIEPTELDVVGWSRNPFNAGGKA